MQTIRSLSSTLIFTAAAILTPAAIVFLLLCTKRRSPSNAHSSHGATRKPPAAFIVLNSVTHARLLPKEASHGFVYPAMFFMVSLNALESHLLDRGGGWLFGYGGVSFRITGMRPSGYVYADESASRSIKEKLKTLLVDRGLDQDGDTLEDAWMLTMPSYLGYEGINPLTVYFCYQRERTKPWAIVLEVHNTFGERHAYVLQLGVMEDKKIANGFQHQWTFPREFHVSPFNDRAGSYVVSVTLPQCSPSALSDVVLDGNSADALHPKIRIQLLAPTDASVEHSGDIKLTALMRPTRLVPFTSANLAATVLQYPYLLFLSLPRILYQAWILHYRRGLVVYPRPEPRPAVLPEYDPGQHKTVLCGGNGWQPETRMQRTARRRLHEFLVARVVEARVHVTLVSGNPLVPRSTFSFPGAQSGDHPKRTLTISYLSSAFFTLLLEAPSARHALLFGKASHLFSPSSEELFISVFSQPLASANDDKLSSAQSLRLQLLPKHLRHHPDLAVPCMHVIDSYTTTMGYTGTLTYLLSALFSNSVERTVYSNFHVRFVAGQEPWRQWDAIEAHM